MRVRIVTDSTSDIPADVTEHLGITVVPAYVQMGGQSYADGTGLSREAFYARLPDMPAVPTTSVPPPHDFTQAYRRLAAEADEVVAIVVSTALSGMYGVARLGAQAVPELKVHVVDSGQVSMGLGWLAVAAAEAAQEGRDAPGILRLVEELKPRVRVFAMLDTLEYLRRSGRVGWARARAAQVLRIKPLVEVVLGKVRELGQARTRRRAIDRLVDLVRELGPIDCLAVLHTYAAETEDVRRRLLELCSPRQIYTVGVTTIIGAHVGPRGLGVAAVIAR